MKILKTKYLDIYIDTQNSQTRLLGAEFEHCELVISSDGSWEEFSIRFGVVLFILSIDFKYGHK